jgi:hypothetical protein
MPASIPPSSVPPQEAVSFIMRFGTAVGLAAVAALTCALPATMRISNALASEGTARVWTALAAAALGPMVAAVVVLRGAREGMRAFGGPGSALRAFGVALWLASLMVGLSVFGSVLRATTHQHALAGVTFAFGAVALAIGSGVVCARLVSILRDAPPGARRVFALVLGLLSCAAVAWVGLGFVRAASSDSASSAAAGTVVDILAFALAALFGARRSFVARRPLALVGPPVAVVLLAVGASTLRDAPLLEAIGERAPAFAPAASLVVFR